MASRVSLWDHASVRAFRAPGHGCPRRPCHTKTMVKGVGDGAAGDAIAADALRSRGIRKAMQVPPGGVTAGGGPAMRRSPETGHPETPSTIAVGLRRSCTRGFSVSEGPGDDGK